jgi:hypothetical protein
VLGFRFFSICAFRPGFAVKPSFLGRYLSTFLTHRPACLLAPLTFSGTTIAKLPASDAQAINIRSIHGEPWYQIFTSSADRPVYISAMDGRVDPLQDERYAAQIASSFLGGAKVRKENYLTAFDNEYINIFRVLPVYRFDIDDAKNSRVYVSTMTGSVTRHTDDIRQFEANIFTNFHKLGFIANKIARDVILTFLTLGAFTVACLGIALFFLTSPARSERAASERRVSKPLNKYC